LFLNNGYHVSIYVHTDMSYFLMVETFGGQVMFVIVVVAFSMAFTLSDIATAQVSQGLTVVWAGLGFAEGWRRMPRIPAKNEQGETKGTTTTNTNNATTSHHQDAKKPNLLLLGFVQNWNTCKHIHREYKHSLRWFLWGTAFGESAASAFITVSVIVLTGHLGLAASDIGIFFVIALMGVVAACRPSAMITNWTNPSISWRLGMLYTAVLTVIGALTLTRENAKPYAFVWGFCVALGLGWHYQANYTYYTMVVPKHQEAEIAGFYNYCRLIFSWLPPLLFSLLVEADVSQSIGMMVNSFFFLMAVVCVSFSASWEDILKEVNKTIDNEIDETEEVVIVDP